MKVVVCSCVEELHQRIDTSQLPSELGGHLSYHHQEWIDTRVVSAFIHFLAFSTHSSAIIIENTSSIVETFKQILHNSDTLDFLKRTGCFFIGPDAFIHFNSHFIWFWKVSRSLNMFILYIFMNCLDRCESHKSAVWQTLPCLLE